MFKKVALAALLAAVVSTTAEAANPATSSFNVTASFAQTCSVNTTGGVDFGTFGTTNAAINSIAFATLNINCSQGTPYVVKLISTTPGGATGFNMVNGLNQLSYKLFPGFQPNVNPAFSSAGLSNIANGTGSAGGTQLLISGEIQSQAAPAGGWGTAGSTTPYSDTVSVEVSY